MRGFYTVKYFRDNRLYHQYVRENAIFNEGELLFMAPVLTGTAVAASAFYVGLWTSNLIAPPPLNSTLASMAQYEVLISNPGYNLRLQINRDATPLGWQLSVASGNWNAVSPGLVFTATGNWSQTVSWAFLTTTQAVGDTSGKLISMIALDPVTPLINDQIQLSYNLTLQ